MKYCSPIFKFLISLLFIFFSINLALANTQKLQEKTFEGYQIKFDYEKYPEEREIGYQYYLDEESKYLSGIKKENIGIDLYDIDGDGKQEIFMYVNGGDRCPRSGCSFIILKLKNERGYKQISRIGIDKDENIKILSSTNLNYQDILFDEHKKIITVWRWNGEHYDIKYRENFSTMKNLLNK